MSAVTLKYRGQLKELIGKDFDSAEVSTVKDSLKFIKASYGQSAFSEAKRMLIAVNGKSILLLDNMKTPLAPGDTVTFLPLCGGG